MQREWGFRTPPPAALEGVAIVFRAFRRYDRRAGNHPYGRAPPARLAAGLLRGLTGRSSVRPTPGSGSGNLCHARSDAR